MLQKVFFSNLIISACAAAALWFYQGVIPTFDLLLIVADLFALAGIVVGLFWSQCTRFPAIVVVLLVVLMKVVITKGGVHAVLISHVLLAVTLLAEAGLFASIQGKGDFSWDWWVAAFSPTAPFCARLLVGKEFVLGQSIGAFVLTVIVQIVILCLIWRKRHPHEVNWEDALPIPR